MQAAASAFGFLRAPLPLWLRVELEHLDWWVCTPACLGPPLLLLPRLHALSLLLAAPFPREGPMHGGHGKTAGRAWVGHLRDTQRASSAERGDRPRRKRSRGPAR